MSNEASHPAYLGDLPPLPPLPKPEGYHSMDLYPRPIDALLEVPDPTSEVQPAEQKNRWARAPKIVKALVAADLAGLIGGMGVVAHDYAIDRQAQVAPGPASSAVPDLFPSDGLSQTVRSDLTRAVGVDTCLTKVTVDQVGGIYQQLFSEQAAPSRSLAGLAAEATTATVNLEKAHDRLKFAPLNRDGLNQLLNDAKLAQPKLPLNEYEQSLTNYLKRFGVETVYTWNPAAVDAPDGSLAKPMTQAKLEKARFARNAIASAMQDFSYLPVNIVQVSGVKRIVFGDLKDKDAWGEAMEGEHDIFIDVYKSRNYSHQNADYDSYAYEATATHENTHYLDFSLCMNVLGQYTQDPAFTALTTGITYSKKSAKLLSKQPVTANHQTTLQTTRSGQVDFAQPYGATDAFEDVATIGEELFNDNNQADIYGHTGITGQNLTALQEKYAFLLARVETKDPATAAYFVRLLQANRLAAAANDRWRYDTQAIAAIKKSIAHTNPTTSKADLSKLNERIERLNKQANAFGNLFWMLVDKIKAPDSY